MSYTINEVAASNNPDTTQSEVIKAVYKGIETSWSTASDASMQKVPTQ